MVAVSPVFWCAIETVIEKMNTVFLSGDFVYCTIWRSRFSFCYLLRLLSAVSIRIFFSLPWKSLIKMYLPSLAESSWEARPALKELPSCLCSWMSSSMFSFTYTFTSLGLITCSKTSCEIWFYFWVIFLWEFFLISSISLVLFIFWSLMFCLI